MNIQAMMKQAKKIQKEMENAKGIIDDTIYEGSSSFVHVKVNGKKEIQEVKIEMDELEKEDIEILEDLLVVSINDAMKKIDKDTPQKLGKYTQRMPGLF